ncbi:MAG: hypothetical protein ACI87W_002295 [Halieaceae bacterium]
MPRRSITTGLADRPRLARWSVFLLLLGTPLTLAQSNMALSDYIDEANRRGYNIIYSSEMVGPELIISREPGIPVTLGELRQLLRRSGLQLEEIAQGSYLVAPVSESNEAGAADEALLEPPQRPVLEEIIVSSSRYRWFGPASAPDLSMSGEKLSRRAVVGNDPVRVLNQLPGSASVGVSARPRVRGGRENETLIEFDGVRLYEPFHFDDYNSLYSVFDSRLLDQIDFYSAAPPVSYGDRLSAAMVIRPPDPAEMDHRREVGIGLFQLSYLHKAQIKGGDLLVTARRSGPKVASFTEQADLGHPEFGDLFISYARDTHSGERWRFNLMWFGDDLSLSDEDDSEVAESNTSNTYLWARQELEAASGKTRITTFGLGRMDRKREGVIDEPEQVVGEVESQQTLSFLFANQDWQGGSDRSVLAWGWDYRYLSAEYNYDSEQRIAPAFASLSNISRAPQESIAIDTTGHQLALHANWRRRLADKVFLESGLRLDAQRYEGQWNAEPGYRLGLLYRPNEFIDMRAAFGRFSQAQGLHEIEVADLDTRLYSPQTAHHLVAAIDLMLPAYGLTARLEGYAKAAGRVTPYYDNLTNPFTLLPELRPDRVRIDSKRYEAQGLELSISGDWELFSGWFNFAYSSAEDRIEDRYVSRSWDQSRTINTGLETRLGAWSLSLAASFHEGWLTTPLRLVGEQVEAGERNSERFDHYLSIDVKGTRYWSTRVGDLRFDLGISNMSDRDNQIGTDQEFEDGALTGSPFFGLPRALFADLYLSF